MEYGKIIKQALEIAWRKKYLWVFGFFASMGGGGGGNYNNFIDKDNASGAASGVWDWITSHPGLVALLILAAIGLFIVLMVLYLVSKGGLIGSVSRISKDQPDSFEKTLGYGLQFFWRMLGIDILFGLSYILILGLAIFPPVMMIIVGGSAVKIFGILLIILLILPVVALMYCIAIIGTFSAQIAVIEDKKVFDSIPAGYALFKGNLGRSVMLGLIIFGIAMLYVIAFIIAMVILAIPFIILGVVNIWAGLIPGIVIGLPLILIVNSIFGTFNSGYWTLAYLELSAPKNSQPKPEPVIIPDV
ncbi:MAG: hypothetical protein KJ620_04845 [Candidatus Edwardsbacteria bacterium]|nr:hypothetical protein [Candidatus Edwardsbacteria bacterium]MBU1575954.1 hypothetical protein [Candidatus Edwardsbacteria bacterium]MBU2463831.1 hypothetical protein [Candidatus Edwardsbacteria bacterium]MBU2593703.1 hypothetical protein [Candidatus Edwardsbacteria bacterium]